MEADPPHHVNSSAQTEPESSAPALAPAWNLRHLIIALVVAFVIQSVFLPCLCQIGTAKMAVAICFDALVLLRILIAYWRSERGNGWLFYTVLCYSSPAWIELSAYVVLGHR